MKLIIGLGNPGEKYQHTRHNVGAQTIAKLLQARRLDLQNYSKLSARLTQIGQGSKDRIFLGVTTEYMNNSGIAVKKISDFFKIPPQDVIIIHDELDLPVGEWRFQFGRGPAGNNGVKSVIEHLGTQDFHRYRIGIGHPRDSQNPSFPVEDYVLTPFNPSEKVLIGQTIDKIVSDLEKILGH